MRKLLSFETLMAPAFIHLVYWLGIAVSVLAGVRRFASGASSRER